MHLLNYIEIVILLRRAIIDALVCLPLQSQKNIPDPMVEQHKRGCGYVIVSADFDGAIKVFINKTKPKHSSLPYTACMD